jgi:hypothetical protein
MVGVIKEGPLDLSPVVAGMRQRAMMRTLGYWPRDPKQYYAGF